MRKRHYKGYSSGPRFRGPKMTKKPDCVCDVCGAEVKGRIKGNWRNATIYPYPHKSRLDGSKRCMGGDRAAKR